MELNIFFSKNIMKNIFFNIKKFKLNTEDYPYFIMF